jgi:hypothetical protein
LLTHCPECQGELSTAATTCPHCGVPVDHGKAAQPAKPAAQSHTLRNCLACGCVLVVLLTVAGVFAAVTFAKRLAASAVSQKDAPALAAKIAPGTQPPPSYELKGGLDFNMFGWKAQCVAIGPQGKNGNTVILTGAFSGRGRPG